MVNLTERAIMQEKGKLIKDALKIVNELAKSNLDEMDSDMEIDDFEIEELQKLILKARNLKRSRWWDV